MLTDNYLLRSTIHHDKKGVNQNIRTFLDFFNNFYNRIRQNQFPSLFHDMCDPYGFALMCQDYKDENIKYDMNLTCQEIFESKAEKDHCDLITYHGQFTFFEILEFLYRGFWFDYDKAIHVYENQHDALNIFKQIINGNGFVFNRVKPELTQSRGYMKNATESIISLDENKPIKIPHIWRLCDGMVAPFIVMEYHREINIEKAQCHGYGEGIFLISNDKIIDVLKINDTWFTDLPLENRIKYAYKCTEYEVAQYIKAWSWRSILEAGKLLKANSTNGLLVRSSREDFFSNRWFNWSKTSLIYCFKINGQLKASSRGRAIPTFYTLEGDEGIINPFEERKKERIWLDDFDINEFQKILELKYHGN